MFRASCRELWASRVTRDAVSRHAVFVSLFEVAAGAIYERVARARRFKQNERKPRLYSRQNGIADNLTTRRLFIQLMLQLYG